MDAQAVVICKDFGWTYSDYLNQPIEFIELIKEMMKIDAQRSDQELKKIKK